MKYLQKKEQEADEKYRLWLQRQAESSVVLPTAAEIEVTPEMIQRSSEVTLQLQTVAKKNLLDAFHIDIQIASTPESPIAANKKLRYKFALEFIQRHWRASAQAHLKLRDLLK